MKTHPYLQLLLALGLALVAGPLPCPAADPLGTAFTYQGRLWNSGVPANGNYDFTFTLFDLASGGSAKAGPIARPSVPVNSGVFTVTLDFGPVFHGDASWLEIAASPSGSNTFLNLLGRQPLTPTPNALFARTVASNAVTSAQIAANTIALSDLAGAVLNQLVPPGTIVAFGGPHGRIPEGWLLCDGRQIQKNGYWNLYYAIGDYWGVASDPSQYFVLPDLRGTFLRGVNLGRTGPYSDPDVTTRVPLGGIPANTNTVGSVQLDENKAHNHKWRGYRTIAGGASYQVRARPWIDSDPEDDAGANAGGSEARSKNAYVNYIIKY